MKWMGSKKTVHCRMLRFNCIQQSGSEGSESACGFQNIKILEVTMQCTTVKKSYSNNYVITYL